jgi:hypothetical protein
MKLPIVGQAFLVIAMILVSGQPTRGAGGDDLSLQAKLIWGTDGDKPKDRKLQDVDPETTRKFRGVFKWKNYYEVSRTNFVVAAAATRTVRMSPKCEVKVTNQGKSRVAVELFGEGKMVVEKRQVLKPGELLVLAGDDKNNTAWFVVLEPGKP